jgi:hypothetical protein
VDASRGQAIKGSLNDFFCQLVDFKGASAPLKKEEEQAAGHITHHE